jgi:hypothetical protein
MSPAETRPAPGERPVSPQSYEKHTTWVPGYHYVTTLLIVPAMLWFGYRMVSSFSLDSLMLFSLALGLNLVGFYARAFAVGVQDRVIRGEELGRLAQLFPDGLKGRIADLTTDQLVGLRFASDAEVAQLCEQVLQGTLTDRKSIKQAIKNWRPDEQRV